MNRLFVGGAWRNVAEIKCFVGGAWRVVPSASTFAAGAWRTSFSVQQGQLSVSVVPSTAYGATSRNSFASVITEQVQATPSGGLPPYTYSWAGTIGTATQPGQAQTAFSAPVGPGQYVDGTQTVTVRDARGQTATSTILVAFENFGGGNGQPLN